jgi:multimeric flavodoxin WrbA
VRRGDPDAGKTIKEKEIVMKIVILHGSPKGSKSITLQYVNYIAKKYPHHDFHIEYIAQKIKQLEKNEAVFGNVIEKISSADGVLWAFPLYYYLVHAGYKRFIELIWERSAQDAFFNKYTAVLSTSIHFFDHAAHNYIHAICDDLKMRYVDAFSAGMRDLLDERERKKLITFADGFFRAIENDMPTTKRFRPTVHSSFSYTPGSVEEKIEPGKKRIVVLTDQTKQQENLAGMTSRFVDSFLTPPEVYNLNDIGMKGDCLGCLQCGYNYTCAYEEKDQFVDFYRTKLMTADILVFAGEIRDRYLSSVWKRFFDRSFFYNHTPSFRHKQIGFIISGPLSQIPNIREIFEGYAEVQDANLVDFITDEGANSSIIDAETTGFARRLVEHSATGYMKPSMFLGVGGMKIFRDEIWGGLRFPFQADHRSYKKLGYYDFPHKNYKHRIGSRVLMLLTKIPFMREEIYKRRMKDEMVKTLKKTAKTA